MKVVIRSERLQLHQEEERSSVLEQEKTRVLAGNESPPPPHTHTPQHGSLTVFLTAALAQRSRGEGSSRVRADTKRVMLAPRRAHQSAAWRGWVGAGGVC